jgi:hypothetical protein
VCSPEETGPGEKPRVAARGDFAGYASKTRGGLSGPSAATASTAGAVATKTVGATSGTGTRGRALTMAQAEQHDAQALHLSLVSLVKVSVWAV